MARLIIRPIRRPIRRLVRRLGTFIFLKQLELTAKRIAKKIMGRDARIRLEYMLCNEPLNFDIMKFSEAVPVSRIVARKIALLGYAVVENPVFSPWPPGQLIRFEGRFLVLLLDYGAGVWVYALYRIL
jgi:hypothetical protein